jgi:exodeoxyribonuclease-5
MNVTPHQQGGVDFLDAFLESFERVAVLQGYAGVGKTHVIVQWLLSVIERKPNWKICITAPTHKALDVLRSKCGHLNVEFRTVASLLGVHISRNEDGELTKGMVPRDETFDLVVCDEASMVNREDTISIAGRNFKLVYVGDPAQLPPVKEQHSPAFEYQNKFLLTEVVRQQADNPVVGIATMLRERIEMGASFTLQDIGAFYKADDTRLRKINRATLYKWCEASVRKEMNGRILAYTNATVLQHNKVMHEIMHPGTPLFGIGERVLLNDAYTMPKQPGDSDEDDPEMLTNGMEFTVKECTLRAPEPHGVITYDVELEDKNGTLRTLPVALYEANAKAVFQSLTEKIWVMRKKLGKTYEDREELKKLLAVRKPLNLLAPIRHAYACTVHKSQGSTYDISYVDWNDTYRSEDRTKLMYVAVTRTSNYLVIVE